MYIFLRDRVFHGKEYKYETYSNAFGMTFPYSPEESRELRRLNRNDTGKDNTASQEHLTSTTSDRELNGMEQYIQDIRANKLTAVPEDGGKKP